MWLVLSLAVLEEMAALEEPSVDAPLVDEKEEAFVWHLSQAGADGASTSIEPITSTWWLEVTDSEWV